MFNAKDYLTKLLFDLSEDADEDTENEDVENDAIDSILTNIKEDSLSSLIKTFDNKNKQEKDEDLEPISTETWKNLFSAFNEKNIDDAEKTKSIPLADRPTEEIIEAYLAKRGFEDIEDNSELGIDFVATDPADSLLGEEVPCTVLLWFVETENEEENSEFELTDDQIIKFKQVLLQYLAAYEPQTTDARVDLILITRNIKNKKQGTVSIIHQAGVIRLLLLSEEG